MTASPPPRPDGTTSRRTAASSRRRWWRALLAAGAVVALTGGAAQAAQAAPGVPEAPRTIYTENFENGVGDAPVLLDDYVGAGGRAYTADPEWLTGCNGVVLRFSSPDAAQGAAGCDLQTSYDRVRQIAHALGGNASNHAVSAYTEGDPGADNVQFETATPIPLLSTGRFITFSVDAAETNCFANHALFKFYLLDGTQEIPTFTTPIDPCNDAGSRTVTAPAVGVTGASEYRTGTYAGNAAVLFDGPSLGIRMRNGQASGGGNDAGFDNIRVLDATPALDKTFSPATVTTGSVSRATFTITNTSELGAKAGWSFVDHLPAGVTVADTPATATTCENGVVDVTPGGGDVAVRGDLRVNQASCTVSVNVTSDVEGTHTNEDVDVVGLTPPPPTDLVVENPDLVLEKTGPATVERSGAITWTIGVRNAGPGASSGSTVVDTIPEGVTDVATTTPGCTVVAREVTCVVGPLAAGDATQIVVTGTAPPLYDATLTNRATVTGDDPDHDPGNNTDEHTTTTPPAPDLGLTKTGPATVQPGAEIAWTLEVTNHGPTPSTGSTVTDTVPEGVTDVATTTDGCTVAGRTVTCAVGALAVGERTRIAVTGKAPQTWAAALTNTAKVEGPQDPNPDNDTGTSTTTTPPPPATPRAVPRFDLSMRKSASRRTVRIGDVVTYRLVARNAGPDAAPGVLVTDAVPSALDVTAATTPQGTCAVTGNAVRCAIGTLAPGQAVTVTVRATAVKAGSPRNAATVVPPPGSTEDPGNNTGTATVRVEKPALVLSKRANRAAVAAGGTVTYTIRVRNPSRRAVRDVRVCDTLPSGLVHVRSQAPATLSNGRRCWTVRSLGAGRSVSFTLTARALRGTSGKRTNVVTATSPNALTARARRTVRVGGTGLKAGGVTG
ncbi:DUF11 domain-containing protein [Patulibacter sp. SYSU D01012]|uniref:DUF11 domain-containing protein n=1 Tax=Patulibacter sp. SYSU D01012 TaxID=2817381 RepID=UPI001B30F2C1|nr:DUF11 domain-containing protein [Patulibacter sp. SYSU D01012]